MLRTWGVFVGLLLYLELIFHISCFGWSISNPIFTIMFSIAWAGGQTLIVCLVKGRWKKIIFYGFIWLSVLWTAVQLVYVSIFRQPLLWEAVFQGGADALTDYWGEMLSGILGVLPFLLLLVLPAVIIGIVFKMKGWSLPETAGLEVLRASVSIACGISGCLIVLVVANSLETDFYDNYLEFYNPMGVAETTGVFSTLLRDTIHCSASLLADLSGFEPGQTEVSGEAVPPEYPNTTENGDLLSVDEEASESYGENEIEHEEDMVAEPHEFALDYEVLHELAENDKQTWLADYIQGMEPAPCNDYTGMFEGYNLIYITAESFSPYAIREDVTPTLYRLTHSGFTFENYYVPLWQTSTSDGEYINCTGLIPDGQFSMRKSGSNELPYTLPAFFALQDTDSYAYHNNSLSYYDRYVTHPNLGYDFKACRLGKLSADEWGQQIFPMEHPNQWPASDLEMMQGTVGEYIQEDRFHVYYMTISGHMYYTFGGNDMAAKNRESVEHLDLSENGKAYIACNVELDKALEYLLEQLEAAGQLDTTVICLSADHYPYCMTNAQYEELAGKDLSQGMDLYRNNLILWNAGMEEQVSVTKACGPMDIVPTLLNMFGFSYDSRMYAGRDIFSEEEGLVIFNDRSFVTDSVVYNKSSKQTIWLQDQEGNDIVSDEDKEAYFADMEQKVKERCQFSSYVLQEDYYSIVEKARIKSVQ
ncbi:MAG: LTA synthase family protein [Roseburia sp.]